jgi:peptidoglycan/xylan/chitin deacetylase (PgdA/CDA1 family)
MTLPAELQALADGRYLRLINFHNTTRARAAEYERQLRAAGERFSPVTEDDLLALLDGEPWTKPKPGLVPVLYEGYRNTYDVALPLVERAGLCAWFPVPSAFIDAPVAEQKAMAGRCDIGLVDEEPEDGRHAMSWDELRDAAARGHAIICHTAHHRGFEHLDTDADLEREVAGSRARLEEQLDREIRGLAFLHGSPCGLDARIDAAVRDAGYRYVVSNTKIQRIA